MERSKLNEWQNDVLRTVMRGAVPTEQQLQSAMLVEIAIQLQDLNEHLAQLRVIVSTLRDGADRTDK